VSITPKLMTAEDLAEVERRHEFFRVGDVDAVMCIRLLGHVSALRDIVRRLHESSEHAPDVRAVPMRLVRQDVFDELLAAVGGDK